jgi:short-subunit dehydrogenase
MYKVTIITGASSGMGVEFAKQLLCRPGVNEMWLIARRADRLSALAATLQKASPFTRVLPISADITGRNGGAFLAARLAETAALRENDGGLQIDTLVNNAGFGTYGPFQEVSLDRQLDEIDLNVTSLTSLCGAALPYLKSGSRLINTASLAAFSPMGAFAVYAASKAYVLYFTLGIAAELKERGVRVIALCPGPVDTEFSAVASNGARQKVRHGKSPDKVVRHCLHRLDAGKNIALMAPLWHFKAFASRILPLPLLARLTMAMEKRPHSPSSLAD